jgi:hypothetical protein
MNKMLAARTIDGPAGVSNCSDPHNPAVTEIKPVTIAKIAICSGELANFRAVAAGIISSETISRTPTNCIDIAIIKLNSIK